MSFSCDRKFFGGAPEMESARFGPENKGGFEGPAKFTKLVK